MLSLHQSLRFHALELIHDYLIIPRTQCFNVKDKMVQMETQVKHAGVKDLGCENPVPQIVAHHFFLCH